MTHKERFLKQLLEIHGPKESWYAYDNRMACVEQFIKRITQWVESVDGKLIKQRAPHPDFHGWYLYLGSTRVRIMLEQEEREWSLAMWSEIDSDDFILDPGKETWHVADEALADEVESEPVDEERFFQSLYAVMGFPGEQTLEQEERDAEAFAEASAEATSED